MAQMGQELPTLRPLTRGMVYLSLPVAGFFIVLFAAENLVAILRTPADQLGAQTQSEG
jgi:TRAP-type C4-dicarboxylate transport system permease small subunit